MRLSEAEAYFQQRLARDLPGLLSDEGLENLAVYGDAPDPAGPGMELGCYLESPDGSVYHRDGRRASAYLTFDGVVSSSVKDTGLPAKYASAIVGWLTEADFDVDFTPELAVVKRVDLGEAYNGFAILLDVTLGYLHDSNPMGV